MKKSVEMISVDFSLLKWIIDKLKMHKKEHEDASEVINSLTSLLNQDTGSLIIDLASENSFNNLNNSIKYKDLEIDNSKRQVTRLNKEIFLTPKEFDILYFLAKNRGEVFTKEQIYQAVWKEDYLLDDSNIMAFIRKIRKKIEPNPDLPIYIITIWGIGYKFNDKD